MHGGCEQERQHDPGAKAGRKCVLVDGHGLDDEALCDAIERAGYAVAE